MPDSLQTSVAIIGAGPAGAALACHLRDLGVDATLIERERFPRYHIGESMTGEAGALVRSLGLEAEMSTYPVKHGVRVFGPAGKGNFYVPVMRRTLTGLEPTTTWQVRRAEFDQSLLNAALGRGAKLLEGRAEEVTVEDGRVTGLRVATAKGEAVEVRSRFVADASGLQTFLARHGIVPKKDRGAYANQTAVFSQVTGAPRSEGDDTLIFYQQLHHWAWFIPLDEDSVSVGVVVPASYLQSKGEDPESFYRRELAELNPALAEFAADLPLSEPVRTISSFSYHCPTFVGPGWLCVGDSHRFIDPVFSFGLHVALSEARFAAEAMARVLRDSADEEEELARYQRTTSDGQDVLQDVIDGFWGNPFAFSFMLHHRYVDEFRDLFAGRIYGESANPEVLDALRKLAGRGETRQPVAAPTAMG